MARFRTISVETLEQAYAGLSLVETICPDSQPDMYLYGITQKEEALNSAREALQYRFDREEEAAQWEAVARPLEIAIAVPFGAATLRSLQKGLKVEKEDFAYKSPSEGVRTTTFINADTHFAVTIRDFSKLAVSDSEVWVDEFLSKYGTVKSVPGNGELVPPAKPPQPVKTPAPAKGNTIDAYLNS